MKQVKAMNQALANWNVLNTKLHHFHWFVKGPHFFALHEKFEEYYNEGFAYIDEIAERILTIGGEPISTLKEYLAVATIEEAKGGETAEEMVELLVQDFSKLISEFEAGIEVSEANEDQPSADMFLDMKTSLEKHNWMLNAYLNKTAARV